MVCVRCCAVVANCSRGSTRHCLRQDQARPSPASDRHTRSGNRCAICRRRGQPFAPSALHIASPGSLVYPPNPCVQHRARLRCLCRRYLGCFSICARLGRLHAKRSESWSSLSPPRQNRILRIAGWVARDLWGRCSVEHRHTSGRVHDGRCRLA